VASHCRQGRVQPFDGHDITDRAEKTYHRIEGKPEVEVDHVTMVEVQLRVSLAGDREQVRVEVRPDVRLAELAGLQMGPSGGIAVNEANLTNDPDIYAVGDAVEKPDAVSHATSLIALANVANRQGRRVADHIAGRSSRPVASLGTAIVKVFDVVAATVGWNERRLKAAGRSYQAIPPPFDHATYYPGATRMAVKLLFDSNNGDILGAQIVAEMESTSGSTSSPRRWRTA
jgi:NADPH-dependent 2,4-dienoyl-CoA reductase/sulfur reductase-like enzyme